MLTERSRLATLRKAPNPVNARAGFSLLELLVALTVLAMIIVPLAYFYQKALANATRSSIRTRAVALAQQRMEEILAFPYTEIRPNNQPSKGVLKFLTPSAGAQPTLTYMTAPPVGAAFAEISTTPAPVYNFPLPTYFNPYDINTQGYKFRNRVAADDEYEPIGFYTKLSKGAPGTPPDPRRIPVVDLVGRTATGSGDEQREQNYDMFGRRTIIIDLLPRVADANQRGDSDPDPRLVVDAPDNLFQMGPEQSTRYNYLTASFDTQARKTGLASYGTTGKLIIVQVFWLKYRADKYRNQEYILPRDLEYVELKSFISASSSSSDLEDVNIYMIPSREFSTVGVLTP